jgi:hypothetical protein
MRGYEKRSERNGVRIQSLVRSRNARPAEGPRRVVPGPERVAEDARTVEAEVVEAALTSAATSSNVQSASLDVAWLR